MRIKDTSGEVLQKVSGAQNNSADKVETAKAVESGISQIKDVALKRPKVQHQRGSKQAIRGLSQEDRSDRRTKVESCLGVDAACRCCY